MRERRGGRERERKNEREILMEPLKISTFLIFVIFMGVTLDTQGFCLLVLEATRAKPYDAFEGSFSLFLSPSPRITHLIFLYISLRNPNRSFCSDQRGPFSLSISVRCSGLPPALEGGGDYGIWDWLRASPPQRHEAA